MSNRTLPSDSAINQLVSLVADYPLKASHIKNLAVLKQIPASLSRLLAQFPDNTTFMDQADLETRLTDLQIIMAQAKDEPADLTEVYEED